MALHSWTNLEEAFEKMNEKVALFLERAKEQGEVTADLDIRATSNFILNCWEGALLRIKVTRDSAPMTLFEGFVFDKMLAPPRRGRSGTSADPRP